MIKSIRIVLAPTRNRALNVVLGLALGLLSLLLLLALATYHATDPSLNTSADPATAHAVLNAVGVFGAWLSDLLLQTLGLTSFFLPLWLGSIGWSWMRSRSGGSALLRWTGIVLASSFLPAAFGLLPWHWHWLHLVPVEGVVGRLMAGVLVGYFNFWGAWIVAGILAGAGIYFASAVNFWAVRDFVGERWTWFATWRQNRRELRREKQAERDAEREEEDLAEARAPGRFAGFLARRRAAKGGIAEDLIDEVPAYQRNLAQRNAARGEEEIPITAPVRRASIWERSGVETATTAAQGATASGREPAPQPVQRAQTPPSRPIEMRPETRQAPAQTEAAAMAGRQAAGQSGEIAVHARADAEVHAAPVAPKNISGFRLPPSTLLNAGEGPQTVREDALREEAKVLVEKCAEFDVRGQVVQINPGPLVTTYEFKPEAGVKYSRVTSLADDLCLAMRAESILIERMAGKSTVGIQVPNHDRETIHLRDVLESETFARARSRLTLAMGKD
ncbi:MAG: DNA translocase FtsK 4TM domain-containing protein, partial [Terracidiphilus sp.]